MLYGISIKTTTKGPFCPFFSCNRKPQEPDPLSEMEGTSWALVAISPSTADAEWCTERGIHILRKPRHSFSIRQTHLLLCPTSNALLHFFWASHYSFVRSFRKQKRTKNTSSIRGESNFSPLVLITANWAEEKYSHIHTKKKRIILLITLGPKGNTYNQSEILILSNSLHPVPCWEMSVL